MLKHRNALQALGCIALLAATAGSLANSWTCRQDGLTRHVTVFYPQAPARLPCKVFYSKPMENALPRPLWTSHHAAGYCEHKAEEFVAKLRAWGWSCTAELQE